MDEQNHPIFKENFFRTGLFKEPSVWVFNRAADVVHKSIHPLKIGGSVDIPLVLSQFLGGEYADIADEDLAKIAGGGEMAEPRDPPALGLGLDARIHVLLV